MRRTRLEAPEETQRPRTRLPAALSPMVALALRIRLEGQVERLEDELAGLRTPPTVAQALTGCHLSL